MIFLHKNMKYFFNLNFFIFESIDMKFNTMSFTLIFHFQSLLNFILFKLANPKSYAISNLQSTNIHKIKF